MFLILLAIMLCTGGEGGLIRFRAGVVGMMGVLIDNNSKGRGVRGSGEATARPVRAPRFGVVVEAAPRARRAGGGGVLTGSGSLVVGSAAYLRLLRGWIPLSSSSACLAFSCRPRVLYTRVRRAGVSGESIVEAFVEVVEVVVGLEVAGGLEATEGGAISSSMVSSGGVWE